MNNNSKRHFIFKTVVITALTIGVLVIAAELTVNAFHTSAHADEPQIQWSSKGDHDD